MSLDLTDMTDDIVDNWLRDLGGDAAGDGLNDERLVELVSATLRDTRARAQGDLTNLCYAMGRQDVWPTNAFP